MAMYIIDRNSCYGTAGLPDMDPACETQPETEIVCLMEDLYRARMQKAISERGFSWFPETSELGQEVPAGGTRPDVQADELRQMFHELSDSTVSAIWGLSDDEIIQEAS